MGKELKVPYEPKMSQAQRDKVLEDSFYNRDLSNESLDVMVQNMAARKPLIISFGGHGDGEALYGWSKAIYDFPEYSHVSVRDSFHCWYFNGIRGATIDIGKSAHYLSGFITDFKAPMTVTCGTSGGGYAAMLFGSLLKVDNILALAPQTLLQDGISNQTGGVYQRVHAALKERPQDKMYTDLRNFSFDNIDTEIVYSFEDKVDEFQALRMEDKPGIRYTLSRGSHGEVAKYYRDDGYLSNQLRSYL